MQPAASSRLCCNQTQHQAPKPKDLDSTLCAAIPINFWQKLCKNLMVLLKDGALQEVTLKTRRDNLATPARLMNSRVLFWRFLWPRRGAGSNTNSEEAAAASGEKMACANAIASTAACRCQSIQDSRTLSHYIATFPALVSCP